MWKQYSHGKDFADSPDRKHLNGKLHPMIREAGHVLTVYFHTFAVEHFRQPANDDTAKIDGQQSVEVDIQRVRGPLRLSTAAPPLQAVWQ